MAHLKNNRWFEPGKEQERILLENRTTREELKLPKNIKKNNYGSERPRAPTAPRLSRHYNRGDLGSIRNTTVAQSLPGNQTEGGEQEANGKTYYKISSCHRRIADLQLPW